MRLKPNTTYTISLYGRKSSATVAPWHFVIHDGRDNTYNWADAIKSDDIELDQSTYLNRYTFTFTTDASAGSQLARVGIHPPSNSLWRSYFLGHSAGRRNSRPQLTSIIMIKTPIGIG